MQLLLHVFRPHLAARIDRVRRHVRPAELLHHVAQAAVVIARVRHAHGFARRERRVENPVQFLVDAFGDQHERLAPLILARQHLRGILHRLELPHVVFEILKRRFLRRAHGVERRQRVAVGGDRGCALRIDRLMRAPPALARLECLDSLEQRRAVLRDLGAVVTAREEHRHRRLRAEFGDNVTCQFFGLVGAAFPDVQVVDHHHHEAIGLRRRVARHVETQRRRQHRAGHRTRGLVRHLVEGRDLLQRLPVGECEVFGGEAADGVAVFVDHDDVDVDELGVGFERRGLLLGDQDRRRGDDSEGAQQKGLHRAIAAGTWSSRT